MIEKNEVLKMAKKLNLNPDTVEKDYVLGWLLFGINNNSNIKSWMFKGGTSLKKCFFETFRFSEDLDFTLSDDAHLDVDFLKKTFNEITRKNFNVKEHYRKGTCVKNRSGKDTLYDDEIHLISNSYFSKMKSMISKNTLGYKRGNEFNQLIDGWVKYWNDILKPKVPLDPDFVKVMIATESSFNPKAKAYTGKRAGHARGLMQVTDQTVKYLAGHRKELRNHLLHLEQDELYDPNINIAAGVRWLYRKKQIADAKFKEASWLETIMLYKGYRSMNHIQIKKFVRLYERIKNEKN